MQGDTLALIRGQAAARHFHLLSISVAVSSIKGTSKKPVQFGHTNVL